MERWVIWFRDLRAEDKDMVGRKCANLGELTRMGLRVPQGFAVSVRGCEDFMTLTRAADDVKRCVEYAKEGLDRVDQRMATGCRARDMVESKSMPAPMEREIRAHYRDLCRLTGIEDQPVAVRSSGAVSMPGQMETYLNIRGEEEVILHVKKVWGSAYTARAITYRLNKGLPVEWAPIGVAVMPLVDTKAAGVALTVLPTTGDLSKIVIEGNWGFGESVVSGDITPDSFLVDKRTAEITDRKIARKVAMVDAASKGTLYRDTSYDLRDSPCVADEEIREIARVALAAEEHFGEPQDMEWAAARGMAPGENIFWLQARPARYASTEKAKEMDYLIGLMADIFK